MKEQHEQPTLKFNKDPKATTARRWLVVIFIVVALVDFGFKNLYPFLAENHPLNSKVLVLEGWLPDNTIQEATKVFQERKYEKIITTGGPLVKGFFLSEYKTNAELTSATLKKIGFNGKLIVAVPAPEVNKDRTYAAAVALKEYLSKSDSTVKSIDVYSLGPHARRSRLLFQKALGNSYTVGVISSNKVSYTPEKWWKSSNGFRDVISEFIAYLYAKVFFSPNI